MAEVNYTMSNDDPTWAECVRLVEFLALALLENPSPAGQGFLDGTTDLVRSFDAKDADERVTMTSHLAHIAAKLGAIAARLVASEGSPTPLEHQQDALRVLLGLVE